MISQHLPKEHKKQGGLSVNKSACIGCSLCVQSYPELFEMKNKKATLKEINGVPDPDKLGKAIESCPVKAISCAENGIGNVKEFQEVL